MRNKINAAFNAAFGEAVSIRSVVLQDKLVIAKKTAFDGTKAADTLLISNNPLIECDELFSVDDFQTAFAAYQVLTASGRCIIQEDLRRFDLENVIDSTGQKENGQEKYDIDRLHNGHWAILASCWWFYRMTNSGRQYDKVMNALDTLESVYAGNDFFVTI